MGCSSEQGSDCVSDETPYHRVTISQDYYIGKFEVTQELWEAVMGTNSLLRAMISYAINTRSTFPMLR